MAVSQATLVTPHAEEYLNQLCVHWNRQFPVTYTPYEGWIPFNSEMVCKLNAEDGALRIRLSLADGSRLKHFQSLVTEQINHLAPAESSAALMWSDTADETAETFATVPDFVEETIEATGDLKDYVVRIRGRNVEITYSEGPGEPLVLFHGAAGSAHSFLPIMPALEAAGYRPVAVNLPGYRGSEKLSGDFPTLEQVAEHLKEFFDEIAIERADIVGHSLGGIAAGALAHYFPDRVAGMVLSSPPKGLGAGKAWSEENAASVLASITEGARSLPENGTHDDGPEGSDKATIDMLRAAAPNISPAGLRFAIALCGQADLQDPLADTPVPTAFVSAVRGTEPEAVPGKEIPEVHDVDHSDCAGNSAEFVQMILAGFASLPRTARA